MRSSGIAVVVLTLVTLAEPAPAQSPPAPTGPGFTAPLDSVGKFIHGVWVSDADPTGVVTISPMGLGTITIQAAGRFRAVGYFDGHELVGLTTTVPKVGVPADIGQLGILRARYRRAEEMEVEFAADLSGTTPRRERWTFHRKFGAPDANLGPGGEALPKLGDYVYVEELPEAIEKVPPDYPEWARRKDIAGTVLVQALVGKDGRVKDTKIARSIPELDDYAVAAVKQWRFKPALSKGSPVAVWVAIPVKFSLK